MKPSAAAIPAIAADALEGRVIVVTGAHGGLGTEAAKACARAGATVILVGRKLPKLYRLYDALKAIGPEPALYPMDLAGADPADYEQLADKLASELGGINGLLHCAAEFKGLAPLETVAPEDFVRNLHVNFTAPWLLTQACLPALRAASDSAVVFVGDDPARVGRAYWGAYGLAKQGVEALAAMLHEETDNSPVRVACLRPGPMRSDIRSRAYVEEAATQVPPPAVYAPACVHLLSEAGRDLRGCLWAPRPVPA